MKTTFKFIIAALSAIAVFASCQKELGEKTSDSGQKDGLRVITVQFDNPTKASLGSDGLTPKFANGDKIRVSNDTESKECEISISGDVATFTTDLTGNLTAIYPAAAAVFTGTSPITYPFFKVEASQDGDIAKAIIAKAEIADASSCATATFRCQTALFQITPPSGVTTFKIKSLNTIDASTGQRSTAANAVAINTEGANEAAKREITVTVPSGGTAYVALVYGVNLSDLSFEYITDESHGAMKGIPTNDIKALASSSGKTFDQANATAANTKYTINNGNWHPYVTIGGKKWATMNIGVTSATEAGTYFAWGDVTGQTPSGSTFSTSFDWAQAPFNNGASGYNATYFASVKDSECPGGILALKNDAANANWGGSWRMPTKAEFEALGSGDWVPDPGEGRQFGTYPNTIFLLPAGYGDATSLHGVDINVLGHYWSSSLDNNYAPDNAYFLDFGDNDHITTSSYTRCNGRSVRALSE